MKNFDKFMNKLKIGQIFRYPKDKVRDKPSISCFISREMFHKKFSIKNHQNNLEKIISEDSSI